MTNSGEGEFEREREIFFDALDIASEEKRNTFIDQACDGDDQLRIRVRTLIENHHETEDTGFMDTPAWEEAFERTPASGKKVCEACSAKLPGGATEPLCPSCLIKGRLTGDSNIWMTGFNPGSVICGHEIIRKLGVGGMGVVFEARHTSLRRTVALKMIRTPGAATQTDFDRFRQEAEAAARLSHPNIVEVYETGEFEGMPYFTMKYVEGARALGAELANGPMDAKKTAQLVSQVARAVSYAHHRGVIHRDLKPANILLDQSGHPSVIDFGLAKLFGHTPSMAEASRSLSDDGKLIGTPYYMSPEQIRGEDLTTSTDVYSLGVVIYEMLTGSPPFKALSLDDMLNHISHVDPKPPTVKGGKLPRDLEVISLKCLRKQPKHRYATVDALADDLDRWLDSRPIHARPSSTAGRFAKWARRHPGVAALSPIVAILSLVAILLLTMLWQNAEKRVEGSVDLYLKNAKAQRTEWKAGRRWRSLESISKAVDILGLLPEKRRLEYRKDLQNEAAACLSLIDLRRSLADGDRWLGDPAEQGLVRLSPDFSSYAHIAEEGGIVVRERLSNNELGKLEIPESSRCLHMLFNQDNLRLAAALENPDGSFQSVIWDLESEGIIGTFPINSPDAFDFSEDGDTFLYAHGESAFLVHLEHDEEPREFKLATQVHILRLNPEADAIAVCPLDESGSGAAVFDINTGGPPLKFEGSLVESLEWNPRGRWLAMGCDDGMVQVWDTQAKMNSPDRISPLSSGGKIAIENIAWHPRGVLIAGNSNSGEVYLWHARSRELEVVWSSGQVTRPQFSPDTALGSRLGPIIAGNQVSLLEVAEGRIVSHARGHSGKVYGAWWRDRDLGKSPSRIFASAGDDGVRIWNRRGFEKAFIPEPGARAAIFGGRSLFISSGRGISIRSVTGGGNLLNSKEVTLGSTRRFHEDVPCFDADYDPVNQRLAVAAGDHVRIYQIKDGAGFPEVTLLKQLPAPAQTSFVDISFDGKWLASGSEGGGAVQIWETATWKLTKNDFSVKGSTEVIFYHDHYKKEDWFVTSGGNDLNFYEVGSWKQKRSLPSDQGKEHGAISFSPRTPVFAASEGLYTRIYDLHGFVLLMNPEFVTQQKPVCLSPGGIIMMTTDRNHTLHLWDLRLLRKGLKNDLNLDLDLKEFEDEEEPPLIDSVIVE